MTKTTTVRNSSPQALKMWSSAENLDFKIKTAPPGLGIFTPNTKHAKNLCRGVQSAEHGAPMACAANPARKAKQRAQRYSREKQEQNHKSRIWNMNKPLTMTQQTTGAFSWLPALPAEHKENKSHNNWSKDKGGGHKPTAVRGSWCRGFASAPRGSALALLPLEQSPSRTTEHSTTPHLPRNPPSLGYSQLSNSPQTLEILSMQTWRCRRGR